MSTPRRGVSGSGGTCWPQLGKNSADAGYDDAVLWVLVGNDRAERFYRRDGWLPDGAQRRVEVWDVAVDEVRYHRALS